jgi:anti-sigma-K factor RskA
MPDKVKASGTIGPTGWADAWGPRITGILERPVPLGILVAVVILLVIAFGVVGESRRQVDTYVQVLAGVADGRVVQLAPQGANSDARGAVVIPAAGQPYVVLRLAPPPAGRMWQAWVLRPSAGGPFAVPAGSASTGGVFTVTLTAPLAPGDGVAITLELATGAGQPTSAPVLVVART